VVWLSFCYIFRNFSFFLIKKN